MTGHDVQFRLLGTVGAVSGGRPIDLGVRKQRFVLAVLLLELNKLVPTERLIALTWPPGTGRRGPDQPRRAMHTHISRLRRALADADVTLVGGSAGYQLLADPDRVDAHRFRALVRTAMTRPDDRRVPLLAAALDLWTGPALASVTDERTRTSLAASLEEARLTALEERLDAQLRLGRQHDVIDELSTLATRNPQRQRLTGQLMLALHRAGRTDEALGAYARASRRMAEQTGLAPAAGLARLHLAILRDDPSLASHQPDEPGARPGSVRPGSVRSGPVRSGPVRAGPVRAGAATRPGAHPTTAAEPHPATPRGPEPRPAPAGRPGPAMATGPDPDMADPAGPATDRPPRQLPAVVTAFTGRDDELRRLAEPGGPTATVPAVHTITGMAGVGKTTLAVRAGHLLAPRYPDGQLFLDLHGFTHGVPPTEPADALDQLLRALGVPGEQVPAQPEQRAALLRSTLAGRRMLLLLDNAGTEEQVRPLLPGVAGCLVLVTSRYPLTGLDEARPVPLDVPGADESAALFEQVVGRPLPAPVVAEVVGLCGRLPLALRLAAARLRDEPEQTVAGLADRLRDERRRFGELAVGQRSVAAAFALSYRQLPPDQRRLFRLLGLHPGTDFDAPAAAALAGTEPAVAGRLLDALVRAHLLGRHGGHRYQPHDLLRDYAARCAAEDEPAPERAAALSRLRAMYRHTASVAMDLFLPTEAYLRPTSAAPDTPGPTLTGYPDALAWLDAECDTLVAVAASDHDRPEQLDTLTRTIAKYLTFRGRYDQERALLTGLRDGARRLGRPDTEAYASSTLGTVCRRTGRPAEAVEHLAAARAIAQRTGNRVGESRVLRQLGLVQQQLGRLPDAIASLHQALAICRDTDNRHDEGFTLLYLAHCSRAAGRPDEAAEYLRDAFEAHRVSGEDDSYLRVELGMVHQDRGEHDAALRCLEAALAVSQRNEDRSLEFDARHGLGLALHCLGRIDEARAQQQRAVALAGALHQTADEARARAALTRLSRRTPA